MHSFIRMVSSIGDNNAHCLLRSSIGQLVTSLPSNYVVASLYLFLGWLVLFIIKLTTGPAQAVLLLVVMSLFLHAVISLSAFGRLIIHTGAMGNRPVLDPSLEKALLPSGLHASLLIMATDRKRRQTSVVGQNMVSVLQGAWLLYFAFVAHFPRPYCPKMSMYRSPKRKNKSDNPSLSLNGDSVRSRGATGDVRRTGSFSSNTDSKHSQRSSQAVDDGTSKIYPIQKVASNLHAPTHNSPCSSSVAAPSGVPLTAEEEIAIEFAISSMSRDTQAPSLEGSASSFNRQEKENLLPDYGFTNSESNSLYGSFSEMDFDESYVSLVSYPRPSILNKSINGNDLKKVVEETLSTRRHSRRNGQRTVDRLSRRSLFGTLAPNRRSLLDGFREASARISIQAEWNEEEDVRSMYDIAPPAEVVFDDDKDEQNANDEDIDSEGVIMPHPRILNQTRRLRSLRRLVTGNAEASQHLSDAEHGAVEDDDGLVGESLLLLQSPIPE
jgi:hypothetical protein